MQHNDADLALRHLARIVDSSDDAIVSKDLNGVITSWNPAAERMFGYTAAEVVGRSIRLIIPADRQAEEDYVLGQIRAGQPVTYFETQRQRKDGTLVPISLTVSPILDDAGRVVGASKIARDITDRRAAELATQRLAAVVASSDDAIVSKDLEGIVQSWNRGAERLFGYTAGEMIGQSIRRLIPPELQDEEDDVLARIRAGETVEHYETRRRRKDGSELQISLTVSPIVDEAGRVIGASKIARDVTERVRLEAALREQAEIDATLAEVGALVVSSLDRAVIAAEITRMAVVATRAELGAFFDRVVDERESAPYVLAAASGGDPEQCQQLAPTVAAPGRGHTIVQWDDDEVPAIAPTVRGGAGAVRGIVRSYLAMAVRTPAGGELGWLALGHSRSRAFTERHQRLLSGIAAWASVALENARLYVEAREADRLKDEFLAMLSHELRTPLNAIVGYTRLLRQGTIRGESAERAVETVERNAIVLSRIVEDVLDASRIVLGRMRLDLRPLDLALPIQMAISTVQPTATAKGVRLEAAVDPALGPVDADAERLQQIVWNLLTNAVKFTPAGGHVDIRVAPAGTRHVDIVVSDTGMGIRRDFLPFVFDRFRQADTGSTRHTSGLGLGLSIVRHLVELHGGTVAAESEGEGAGACFRVRLPLSAGAA